LALRLAPYALRLKPFTLYPQPYTIYFQRPAAGDQRSAASDQQPATRPVGTFYPDQGCGCWYWINFTHFFAYETIDLFQFFHTCSSSLKISALLSNGYYSI